MPDTQAPQLFALTCLTPRGPSAARISAELTTSDPVFAVARFLGTYRLGEQESYVLLHHSDDAGATWQPLDPRELLDAAWEAVGSEGSARTAFTLTRLLAREQARWIHRELRAGLGQEQETTVESLQRVARAYADTFEVLPRRDVLAELGKMLETQPTGWIGSMTGAVQDYQSAMQRAQALATGRVHGAVGAYRDAWEHLRSLTWDLGTVGPAAVASQQLMDRIIDSDPRTAEALAPLRKLPEQAALARAAARQVLGEEFFRRPGPAPGDSDRLAHFSDVLREATAHTPRWARAATLDSPWPHEAAAAWRLSVPAAAAQAAEARRTTAAAWRQVALTGSTGPGSHRRMQDYTQALGRSHHLEVQHATLGLLASASELPDAPDPDTRRAVRMRAAAVRDTLQSLHPHLASDRGSWVDLGIDLAATSPAAALEDSARSAADAAAAEQLMRHLHTLAATGRPLPADLADYGPVTTEDLTAQSVRAAATATAHRQGVQQYEATGRALRAIPPLAAGPSGYEPPSPSTFQLIRAHALALHTARFVPRALPPKDLARADRRTGHAAQAQRAAHSAGASTVPPRPRS